MKNKVHDILADKKVKLQELTAQAEAAVDIVTRTISGLELVNQEIDDTVAEIDKYSAELACTRRKKREKSAAIYRLCCKSYGNSTTFSLYLFSATTRYCEKISKTSCIVRESMP